MGKNGKVVDPPRNPGSSRDVVLLDASLDGLCGGTADGVHTVSAAVLLVVQEPSRVRQAPDLDPRVALQLLRHPVHIQQNPGPTRTRERRTQSEPGPTNVLTDRYQ